MDWELAIDRNKQALAMIIAGLVDLVALVDGAGSLPRPLHRFICRDLRPAESALRRLIVIVAAQMHRKARTAEKGRGGSDNAIAGFFKLWPWTKPGVVCADRSAQIFRRTGATVPHAATETRAAANFRAGAERSRPAGKTR